MNILSLDTATAWCAVALLVDDQKAYKCVEEIGKGHAERLNGQITTVLDQAAMPFSAIDRIAVNIGPGSFTGIRVGVATARGLALALGKPAIGVSQFSAFAAEAERAFPNKAITVVIGAFQESLYCQHFSSMGQREGEAFIIKNQDLAQLILPERVIIGSGVATLKPYLCQSDYDLIETSNPDIVTFGELAAKATEFCKPKPLYIREPLAEPPADHALPRV